MLTIMDKKSFCRYFACSFAFGSQVNCTHWSAVCHQSVKRCSQQWLILSIVITFCKHLNVGPSVRGTKYMVVSATFFMIFVWCTSKFVPFWEFRPNMQSWCNWPTKWKDVHYCHIYPCTVIIQIEKKISSICHRTSSQVSIGSMDLVPFQ